jgi:signal transduction histidine kinase
MHDETRREQLLQGVAQAARALLSGPWEATFPEVAAILGKATGVSRVYLFVRRDLGDDRHVLDQRFEWCAPGIESHLDDPELQGFDLDALGMSEVREAFMADEPFTSHVAAEPNPALRELFQTQDILSVMTLPVHVRGQWWGFMGLDDCERIREWTDGETQVLQTATLLLGTAVERDLNLEDLRRSETRLAAAVNEVQIGFVIAWTDGTIAEANPAARRIFRVEEGEAVPSLFHVFPSMASSWEDLATATKRQVLSGVRMDGLPFRAGVSTTRVTFGDRDALAVVVRDLAREEESVERIQHGLRLEQVGRLAGGVAHTFNNLLTTILGNAELARDEGDGRPPVSPYLDEIERAARSGARLATQLLAFSRQQVLRMVPVDLEEAVKSATTLLRIGAPERVRLALDLHPEPLIVRGDPASLTRVVVELGMNARDAMPAGGELRISTERVELGMEEVREDEQLGPGPYAVLAVTDYGRGMTRTEMARIFEPFYTTKPSEEGRGLGLSTVHGVVKQSGGEVRVESEPGGGSTFRIYLPLHPGEDPAETDR